MVFAIFFLLAEGSAAKPDDEARSYFNSKGSAKMMVRKVEAAVTLAAAGAAAFAALAAPGTANAAYASFWGLGNSAQCTSTFGSVAIATGAGATAASTGIGAAIALVDGSIAKSDGLFTLALASGKNTSETATGVGSIAADIGDNTKPGSGQAVAVGWFKKAFNVGGDNTAIVTSGLPPRLDLGKQDISIGNNSVVNVGNGNQGFVRDGFSTGVYQIGEGNIGAGGGVQSNLVQIGNDNYTGAKKPTGTPAKVGYGPKPNTAFGLGATNVVTGNRNSANAVGNLVLANTFGNDNKNNATGVPGSGPLGQFAPNLSLSNVFGNGNRVRVRGNGNITSVFGNQNRVSALGNVNLTAVFGHRSTVRSFGNGNVNASLGDDKTSIKSSE